VFCNHRQMAITLCRRTRITVRDGRRARRDHHLDLIAVRGDCLVGGHAIIRTIGRHLDNRMVNLIEQRADLGRIIRILIRQRVRHDHAVRRVHRQMQLAPFPARLHAVLCLQPLTGSVDLQSGAVDQYVQRPMRH
jgi:hypothetical protein